MSPETSARGSARAGGRNARRRAREFAVQGIYQWLLARNDAGIVEAGLRESPGYDLADAQHLHGLLHGTIRSHESLLEALRPHIDRNPDHVSPVEMSILLLATYELREHIEIPWRVVVNEAIDLCKTYGGTDGHRFVNGVLQRVADDLGVASGRR